MKWIKRILSALLILIVIVVIAVVVVVFTFDPNDHKQRIVSAVEKATGRELTLAGDIRFSLYPWLGLSLGAVQLGNAEGFGEQPFASVKQAEVYVAILPLLRGEVQARTLYLEGLTLNLRKNAQGETNWEDLLASDKPQAPAPREPGGGPPDLSQFAIGGIELVDARINWVNEQTDEALHLAPLNLRVGALSARGELNAEADFVLRNGGGQPLQADISLHADEMALAPPRYRFEALRLEVEASGGDLPGERLNAVLTTTLDADLDAGTVQASPLSLESQDVQLAGWITGRQVLESPVIEGELNSEPFNPRTLLASLGQKIETADPAVLEQASVELVFTATEDSATVSKLNAKLDETRISGEASVESFAKPRIEFALTLDAMNLDRYLPPGAAAGEEPPADKAPSEEGADTLGLPVEALRNLNLDGTIKAGKLIVEGVQLTDVAATVTANDGVIRVSGLRSQLYQGGLQGEASLDVRGDTPVFTVNSALKSVQIGPVLQQLLGRAWVNGGTDLKLDLNTRGNSVDALLGALGGNLNFAVKDGQLLNAELLERIERTIAFFQNREAAMNVEKTLFNTLSASATIAEGVLRNGNLSLVSPEILAKGKGTIDLGAKTVDYLLRVTQNDEQETQRFVPIEIAGSFADLNYNLDLSQAIKAQVKQQVEEEIEHEKQELRERLKKEVPGELLDRFNFN